MFVKKCSSKSNANLPNQRSHLSSCLRALVTDSFQIARLFSAAQRDDITLITRLKYKQWCYLTDKEVYKRALVSACVHFPHSLLKKRGGRGCEHVDKILFQIRVKLCLEISVIMEKLVIQRRLYKLFCAACVA